MEPYAFGIVGAGWRAEFFFRIAAALPERFRVVGVVTRDADKGRALEARWGWPTYRTPEALLGAPSRPEFLVASVSSAANYQVNRTLVELDVPLLTETPPAQTLEQMTDLWELVQRAGARVQVAEQFHRQPLHAARLAALRSGAVGTPHTAYLSVCHGYHGTSLIRRFLDLDCQPARVVGVGWTDRVLDPGGRNGPPGRPEVKPLSQQVALLDFEAAGGVRRQALFDFVGAQYFSPIRAQRVTIRGDRGEIVDETLYRSTSGGDAIALPFRRVVAGANGNLEGMHLKGIQLGEEWVYRNPTAPARLSDEEIAMAEMLTGMGAHVRGGPEVYPLREALQDHYLGLVIREACESGEVRMATEQPWAA